MTFFDGPTLWISLKTAACATLCAGIGGFLAAAFMVQKRSHWSPRRFALIDTVLIAPMILPPTVLGFALLLLCGVHSPIGRFWESLFGEALVFSWPATVIAASTVAFPLMYRTTRAALLQVDQNVVAAARTLSDKTYRIYRSVILPAAFPGVLAGLLLAFARSLGEFGATLMLAGSIPGRTRTMPMAIYYAVESGDYAEAALWSLIIMLLSLIVIFFAESRLAQRSPQPFRGHEVPDPGTLPADALSLHIRKALHDFPLDLQLSTRSRRLAVLGASGAGKSLFLRCLAGLERPDAGWIYSDSHCFFHSRRSISLAPKRRQAGILLQNYALFPELSIRDNIAFGMHSPTEPAVNAWLNKIGLAPLAAQKPPQLSGGQQQRVALARALAAEPALLLLDEPFSALDAHLRDQLEQELTAILKDFGGRLILVTHQVDEAWRLADDILIIEEGRITRQGPKAEVFADPRTVYAAQMTGCKNLAPVSAQGPHSISISAWQCELLVPPLARPAAWIGIRAHHIVLRSGRSAEANTFPCWLARVSESPHRLTFFLKLQQPPCDDFDAHLQVVLLRDAGIALQNHAQPWFVTLPPDRLLFLENLNPS